MLPSDTQQVRAPHKPKTYMEQLQELNAPFRQQVRAAHKPKTYVEQLQELNAPFRHTAGKSSTQT